MFYKLAQKVMFQMDAEHAHDVAIKSLKLSANSPLSCLINQSLPLSPVTCMGIEFPNPLGLAAGLDKDGEAIDAFHAMGFGFVEVGTVTPKPQAGNDKPRLFRLTKANAIINRMGFNNKGVDNLVRNLMAKKSDILVGVNIGKNKDTPVEQGKDDYLICMTKVYAFAAYITINISSPNTPGLRSMQYGQLLDELLSDIKAKQAELALKHGRYVPVALKIAPDLTHDEIESIASGLIKHEFDAVIATNTTLSREGVLDLTHGTESGGLSGAPLTALSTQVIKQLSACLGNKIPIIGVGGINSAADALDKFDAGASLVQIYSGFIYQGPELIKQIVMAHKSK